MNKVILMGRLTRKPEISWNEEDLCIARFTLAVDRRFYRMCCIWKKRRICR